MLRKSYGTGIPGVKATVSTDWQGQRIKQDSHDQVLLSFSANKVLQNLIAMKVFKQFFFEETNCFSSNNFEGMFKALVRWLIFFVKTIKSNQTTYSPPAEEETPLYYKIKASAPFLSPIKYWIGLNFFQDGSFVTSYKPCGACFCSQ